jgi:protein TonB
MPLFPETRPAPVSDAGWIARLAPDGPQLAVRWSKPRENFWSSVRAIFGGPRPKRGFHGDPFFRDCWIERRWPVVSFVTAAALQALLLATVHPSLNLARPRMGVPDVELTWYVQADDPAPDLPLLSPASRVLKRLRAADAARRVTPRTDPAADTYNPRQTIWSEPLHPNHPRQELLQPSAPPTPPKILPVLPNIVQWNDEAAAHPRMRLSTSMQPARAAKNQADPVAAPELANQQTQAGPIDIVPSALDANKPALSVPAMSAAQAASRQSSATADAPEIGPSAASGGENVIALSATPGPAAPPPVLPQGNLQARVSMSPTGGRGRPGGADESGASSAGRTGPADIGISNSASLPDAPTASISGPAGAGGAGGRRPSPSGIASASADPRPAARSANSIGRSVPAGSAASVKAVIASGARPESLLGTNEIHTLHVSMPNLASAAGDWVLSFAELGAPEYIPDGRPKPADTLIGPVPVRKVDPKYPPQLQLEKVQGEVVLYAIIRKDGTVDSIQLVRGLDPELDQDAMEALSRWTFRPGSRLGAPVELVAIVHIPFHPPPPEPLY